MSTAAHRLPTDRSLGAVVDAAGLATGPITGSTKSYRNLVDVPGGRVPYRRVQLADGRHVDLYLSLIHI